MHAIVNVINVTVSAMSICPCGNLEYIFISEKLLNTLLNLGKNHVNMLNPTVKTPAIIWFSVILDANIPNDI